MHSSETDSLDLFDSRHGVSANAMPFRMGSSHFEICGRIRSRPHVHSHCSSCHLAISRCDNAGIDHSEILMSRPIADIVTSHGGRLWPDPNTRREEPSQFTLPADGPEFQPLKGNLHPRAEKSRSVGFGRVGGVDGYFNIRANGYALSETKAIKRLEEAFIMFTVTWFAVIK